MRTKPQIEARLKDLKKQIRAKQNRDIVSMANTIPLEAKLEELIWVLDL